jgi:4-hydroxy-tetrahydrodipicolinate synthase
MNFYNDLQGIYAAALTPLRGDGSPDLEEIPHLLDFLARRGCHGALLLGTTGEGPSFAFQERLSIIKSGLAVRQAHPRFRLLAGTGTPSLEETAGLTQAAFDLGIDGVVILPPYYYRNVSDEGLFAWYSKVIQASVPAGGAVLGYHIPSVSGVALSINLLMKLRDAFPECFAGIKDSSGDPEHARELGRRFGRDLVVLTGNDILLTLALQSQAAGCITALANLFSPLSRQVYEAFQNGTSDPEAQARLEACRSVINRYPPAPALLKALLPRLHGFSAWPVRPPLLPLPEASVDQALAALEAIISSA